MDPMSANRHRSLYKAVSLLGVRVDNVSVFVTLKLIEETIVSNQKALIAYANVYAMNIACELPWFRNFLNDADLVFCDGFGVKLGARLLGQQIHYRYTPPDWIDQLCDLCVQNNFSVYLLGAKPGVAEKAVVRLQERHPGLLIAGCQHGYFIKTPGSYENDAVIQSINQASPDILILGFGMPMQERWLVENWASLCAKIALPAGALIDYVAGEVYRAPRWMTDHGLEWLGRLVIEPRRLWRRYLIGNPLFFWRVLMQRFGMLHLK